jgi:hypothetical protein
VATIENVTDWEQAKSLFESMSGPELIAQHLVQRGAIDSLEKLLTFGASTEMAEGMLEGLRVSRDHVASVAKARGIHLISED